MAAAEPVRLPALNPDQAAQLRALLAAAALSEGFARAPADLAVNAPADLAALRRRGLVGRRMRRTVRGGAMPLYWLTPAGLAAVRGEATPRPHPGLAQVPPSGPPLGTAGPSPSPAPRPSQLLLGFDQDPPGRGFVADQLAARPAPEIKQARRWSASPLFAELVMLSLAIILGGAGLAGAWTGGAP